jgi:hypothetical protein
MRSGSDLYQIVAEYSDLGEHRTGTAVDQATIGWLSEHLRQAGAAVEQQHFAFDRYQADWEVRIDGAAVQSLPLFYEGVGQACPDAPAKLVWEPRLSNTGFDATFADFSRTALADGAPAAVVATAGPSGFLHAVNRRPALGSGLLTLLVPGRFAADLGAAQIEVEIDSQIMPGESANVIGEFGRGSLEESIVVTTPISGWFQCAGERGTGIAVALATAKELSADYPVLFIGASGHELHHQGAQKALQDLDGVPKSIVHIGASVAAAAEPPVNGHAELTAEIEARVAADAGVCQQIAALLDAARIRTAAPDQPLSPDAWLGEAKNWAHFERPLFSLVGGFPLFHAPEDTVERATTPALLESVSEAVIDALRLFAP